MEGKIPPNLPLAKGGIGHCSIFILDDAVGNRHWGLLRHFVSHKDDGPIGLFCFDRMRNKVVI
jgi:hypothetical protein